MWHFVNDAYFLVTVKDKGSNYFLMSSLLLAYTVKVSGLAKNMLFNNNMVEHQQNFLILSAR
jgi:hypothetical protein